MNIHLGLIVACAYSLVLGASQADQDKTLITRCKQQKSVYCSALQCWSHKPCLQHPQNNAQSTWHDAQRWLPQQVLYLIGAYARPQHTHTIGRIVHDALFINQAGIFIGNQPIELGWHMLADKSYFTHIKSIESSKGTVARILLPTHADRLLFSTSGRFTADKRDYLTYCKSPFDNSLAIKLVGSGFVCSSTMHLIPEVDSSILQQAGFMD